MDGLVVCAMGGARRGRGFEPRFVCPSRGPPVRSPPPPPSASPSTIGTAGGWVACLVLIFFPLPPVPALAPGTQKRGTEHGTPAAVPSVTGTAGCRVAHFLLVFLLRLPTEEDSNSGLQGPSRLYSRCATLPETLLSPLSPLSPVLNVSVCVWRGGGTQHTINLGYGNGSARAPPRAVFVVCCAVQN